MATNPLDVGKSNEQLLAERGKRLQDAMELKQPDRIPINVPVSYLLAEYGGITHRELQDNVDLAQEILEKFAVEFEPDTIIGLFNSPRPSVALGDRMTKWPGYSLPDSGSFQFDEHEFMKGEDYDAFLRDPSDWAIRTYLPRVFKELEGLQYLPPLGMFAFGHYNLGNLPMLAAPPVAAALQALNRAIQAALAERREDGRVSRPHGWRSASRPLLGRLADRGAVRLHVRHAARHARHHAGHAAPAREAAGRRTSGARLPARVRHRFAKATGLKAAFIPLHRGSDGFMSLTQFEKFYWPQLKEHDG